MVVGLSPIPLEGDEIEEWIPPSLGNLPAPPVFLLRAWTVRDRSQYQYALRAAALVIHDDESVREEVLRGLEFNWSRDTYEEQSARLKAYWSDLDDASDVLADMRGKERAEQFAKLVDLDMTRQVNDLLARLVRIHEPLATMTADNAQFHSEAPKVSLAMLLVGWRGLDTPFRREAGRVSLDAIDTLGVELGRLERRARKDKVSGIGEPGTAFNELLVKSLSHLSLDREEAKNSESPPSSAPAPNVSGKAGRGKTDGRSPAKTAKDTSLSATPPAT